MSRRTAVIEEVDDDTDLPLPSRPLPNTGTKGPLLQEVSSDEDDDLETGNEPTATTSQTQQRQTRPLQSSSSQSQAPPQGFTAEKIQELYPDYKTFTCIYPIYIDAKRPYGTGSRRISREKSVWWPLAKDIVGAASRLRLSAIHEPASAHPRDWENPGRVRVQWKKNGKLLNPSIKSKKQLLEAISSQIQSSNPSNIPKPPYTTAASKPEPPAPSKPAAKVKTKAASAPPQKPKAQGRRRLPIPPSPQPALVDRVSQYSPAIASGVLIETVKAGMAAEAGAAPGTPAAPGAAPPGTPGAGAGKGKRKIVRVRG